MAPIKLMAGVLAALACAAVAAYAAAPTGWTPARPLSPRALSAIAVDSHGQIVIRRQHDGGELAALGLDAGDRRIAVFTSGHRLDAEIDGHRSTIATHEIPKRADPSLAVAPDGSAVVAWATDIVGPENEIWVAQRRRGASAFGPPRAVGMPNGSPPLALIDTRDRATVVWAQRLPDAADSGVVVIQSPPGEALRNPFILATGLFISDVGAAAAPDGRVVVAWADTKGIHAAARQPRRYKFDHAKTLVHDGMPNGTAPVAIDRRGTATIAAAPQFEAAPPVITLTRWPAGGDPTTYRTLPRAYFPRLVTTPQGAAVVYSQLDNGGATARRPLLTLGPAGRVVALRGPTMQAPMLVSGPTGAVAAWGTGDEGTHTVASRLP
jgi:hypothetical protein